MNVSKDLRTNFMIWVPSDFTSDEYLLFVFHKR